MPEPILEVEGLACHFDVSDPWLERLIERRPRRTLKAVDGIGFRVERGTTCSIVGESGCGKSTVARLLVGLHRPTAGTVRFHPVPGADGRPRPPRLQMIFQDPYASLNPRRRVDDIVAEPIRTLGLLAEPRAVARRVDELLVQVGLSPRDARRFPHEFSGGELQRALGLTYLFIGHNLAVIRHVSDRVAVMYLGRIVEEAPVEALFAAPRHPYTRLLIDTIPDLEAPNRERRPVGGEVPSPIDPPAGCAFHPRCPLAIERCRRVRPELAPAGDGAAVACHAAEAAAAGR